MNESQLQAVHFAKGALLLLAGPGSGKTTVITHRVQYLISNLGVSPDKILVITFTKTAAMEMKERFLCLTQSKSTEVVFGTFHAVFYQILKSSETYRNISLMQEAERLRMLSTLLKKVLGDSAYGEPDMAGVLRQISKFKNDRNAAYDMLSDTLDETSFPTLLEEYNSLLREMGKLDFDDMVGLCYKLLQEDPEKRTYWQERFTYILIDEFQDINPLQYEVIKLLTGKHPNLFVVGDDDQSIYGFRGANPVIMKQFLEDFPGAEKMVLNQNYRSCLKIVEAANKVIGENKNRFEKKIRGMQSKAGEVVCLRNSDPEAEYARITEQMKQLHKQGVAFDDMAVLCRNNRDFISLYGALDQEKIPYRAEKYSKTMFDNSYIKTMISYCRYLAGDRSRDNFFRFMNRPVRYIKRASVETDPVRQEAILAYYRGNPGMKEELLRLFEQLKRMERMKPSLALHYLRKVVGLDRYVKGEVSPEQYKEYMALADNFLAYAKEFSSCQSMLEGIGAEKAKENTDTKKSGLWLYTYHGSKGLEFDYVFLPGLIHGHIPPKQARCAAAVEEERRMFYVAMTRAKKGLYLSWVENESTSRSLFLNRLL